MDTEHGNHTTIIEEHKSHETPVQRGQHTTAGNDDVVINKPLIKKHVVSRKVQEVLLYLYVAIAILLLFRFVFALFAASRQTPFVEFIYQLSIPLMFPFADMFGRGLQAGQYRLEFEVLIALLVYALVFMGITKLISIIFD